MQDAATPTDDQETVTVGTVLVVEDDPAMLSLLVKRLESRGHRCLATGHGVAALAAIRHADFDILVTDLDLPGASGVDLAIAVRQSSDVPIIVLTGRREEFRRMLRDVPDVTVMEKPCPTAAIAGLVEAELLRNRSA
jgi:DNA-binding response OmpR family regulator